MRHRIHRTFLALLLVCGLGLPHAAHAMLGEVTVSDEKEMGRELDTWVQARMPLVEDPLVVNYVADLTRRLGKAVPPQPWPLKIRVIRHNALNAFAGPGGYMYVFTGLINNLDSEAELAGVIAHELAHVSQRHLASRLERAQLTNLATIAGVLAGALVGGEEGAAVALGSIAGNQSAMLSYSREHEREADQVGMNYLVESGYPPLGMVGGFENIRRKHWYSGSTLPPYLSTHPGVAERISYLKDRAARLEKTSTRFSFDNTDYLRVQTLVRARYTDPEIARALISRDSIKDCLYHLALGILADRGNRVAEAKRTFARAIECDADDPLVLREAGRFHFHSGDFREAGWMLQKAVMVNPHDHFALFFYARLLAESGKPEQAADYMQRVVDKVPHNSQARYYLGRTLGQAGEVFEAHLQLAYSAVYAADPEKYAFQHRQAENKAKSASDKRKLKELESVHEELSAYWK
jgi:predicted Zn-dependent protease